MLTAFVAGGAGPAYPWESMRSRPAAVAGLFYPDDPATLHRDVRRLLDAARPADAAPSNAVPKALVVPHAGYVYSGAPAAVAYARLAPARDRIRRVVLLGPAHRVPVRGLAAPTVDAFETPLGPVPLERATLDALAALPQVTLDDRAHAEEHSLEVQLPFLQEVLGEFTLLPFAVGAASAEEVAEVLARLWGGDETLILISSDLSHFHDDATARRLDAATTAAIEDLAPERLGRESACGRVPLSGLLLLARERGLKATTLALSNSSDTVGPPDRVVGYGAYAFA